MVGRSSGAMTEQERRRSRTPNGRGGAFVTRARAVSPRETISLQTFLIGNTACETGKRERRLSEPGQHQTGRRAALARRGGARERHCAAVCGRAERGERDVGGGLGAHAARTAAGAGDWADVRGAAGPTGGAGGTAGGGG